MNKDNNYNHKVIEQKWRKIWEEKRLDNVDLKKAKKPYFNLMMYPYPSAEGLHVGNVYAFVGSDVHGRYKKLKGYDVFEPIGFDSGGIHSENYAIKVGVHPKKMTERNIANFTKQLKIIGNMYDWDHTVDVMDPDYYKWTQWIFIQLFKKGLVYKKESYVTWCPSCKTTVSDEQTEKKTITNYELRITNEELENKTSNIRNEEITVCERCKTPVERKKMSQWFLKITKYAEKLLNNTNKLNWPNKILVTQKNWIGRSEGAEIEFRIQNSEFRIKVFTTRPDTLFGCTFFVLAPEHPLVPIITTNNYKDLVNNYIGKASKKTEQDRKIGGKDKTGVFTGGYVINPVNNKKIPIWVADYVLLSYGEGAVMGVPAHDQRDFDFANKYGLEIIPVVDFGLEYDSKNWQEIYQDKGTIINSEDWNGKKYPQDMNEIIKDLEERNIGKKKIAYKLRDWCISRQRYWGPPIPMINCPKCGWVAVSDSDLPVILPDMEDFLPDGSGKSPLVRNKEFIETKCPKCGEKAQRETDVSDTFLDSSWYFLRYPSTFGGDISKEESESKAFDPQITKKWLPVSQYCGGAEHAVLHLMYSRFITMALKDMGYIDFEEPFPNFYAHGLIIKDGAKMSKSRGNVINPDEYIEKYGVDTLRLYFSFMGPYAEGGDFKDTGIAGMQKFVLRIWKFFSQSMKVDISEKDKIKLESSRHRTIKKVTNGIKRFKYNTAIAALMEQLNILEEIYNKSSVTDKVSKYFELSLETMCLLISPFVPYLSEELWQKINRKQETVNSKLKEEFKSVHEQKWPEWDENNILTDKIIIVIQVNGKLRSQVEVETENKNDKDLVLRQVKNDKKTKEWIKDKKIIKEIFVPGKLVNLVMGE